MNSWVHVLARFTPEALLFEALAICLLLAAYFAFWILKKRRYGAAGEVIPAGVVRTYLGELIGDAEHLRTQLFGLLKQGGTGYEPSLGSSLGASSAASAGATIGAGSAEQAQAIEALTVEKSKLEKELAEAKSAALAVGGGAGGGDSSKFVAQINELQGKVDGLEAKLAEYSVIEDDLANLKRLQQENNKLRAALESKGGNLSEVLGANSLTAAAPVTAAPVAAAPAAASPADSPAASDDPLAALADIGGGDAGDGLDALAGAPVTPEAPATGGDELAALGFGDAATTPAPAEAPAGSDDLLAGLADIGGGEAAAPASAPDALAAADAGAASGTDSLDTAAFDSLAGSVDQSLAAESPSGGSVADPLAGLGDSAASSDALPAAKGEVKSDADLVAEFEKMLNG